MRCLRAPADPLLAARRLEARCDASERRRIRALLERRGIGAVLVFAMQPWGCALRSALRKQRCSRHVASNCQVAKQTLPAGMRPLVATSAPTMPDTARHGVKRACNGNDRDGEGASGIRLVARAGGTTTTGGDRKARRLVLPIPRPVCELPKLRVATLCSGIEAVIQAYENARLPHLHVAACDSDERVRSIIGLNFKPQRLLNDVTRLDVKNFPSHDMLWAGFPCQPFSSAGSRGGFDDDAGRGVIVVHILRLVMEKMPRIVVLENVGGLTSHRDFFRGVIEMLQEIRKGGRRYVVDWRKLDTKHFGVPHSRPRVWIVCVRDDVLQRPLVWPTPDVPCTKIDKLLGPRPARAVAQRALPPAGFRRENLLRGLGRLRDRGVDPFRETCIIEIDHSLKWHGNSMQGCSPCLTRARAQAGGHWVSTHGRRLGTTAMLKLQGMRPDRIQLPPSVSASRFNAMIGNSMSVNIVEALLGMLRRSVGRID